jgi:hypothetical protein
LRVQTSATRKLTTISSSREGIRYSSTSGTRVGAKPTRNSNDTVLGATTHRETKASIRRRYLGSGRALYALIETRIRKMVNAASTASTISP